MSKLTRVILLAALFLLLASSSFADTLEVTFSVGDFLVARAGVSVSGSFLWNTNTQTLYDGKITIDTVGIPIEPIVFDPSTLSGEFALPGNSHGYPAGSLDFFSIVGPPGTSMSFQMDLGNHAFLNPPIVPGPGGPYTSIPYFLDNVASDGVLTVREASEPCSALLVALGALALSVAFTARKVWL
jgi:hypothetical protein